MIRLAKALHAWGTPDFNDTLKVELKQLGGNQLPLQQGLSCSSHALDGSLDVLIISTAEDDAFIHAKAGIFYSGIIAGCSCADDPTPIDEITEYCEVLVDIDKTSATTTITLLSE